MISDWELLVVSSPLLNPAESGAPVEKTKKVTRKGDKKEMKMSLYTSIMLYFAS